MNAIQANPLARYDHLAQQIRAAAGDSNAGVWSKVATDPLPGYDTAEIMLGSRVGGDPEEAKVVHVYDSRQVNGHEEFAVEAFVSFTDRGPMDRLFKKPGDAYLYHYTAQFVRGGSGNQLVDAALVNCDPTTGRVRESLEGRRAIDQVWKLEDRTGCHITA